MSDENKFESNLADDVIKAILIGVPAGAGLQALSRMLRAKKQDADKEKLNKNNVAARMYAGIGVDKAAEVRDVFKKFAEMLQPNIDKTAENDGKGILEFGDPDTPTFHPLIVLMAGIASGAIGYRGLDNYLDKQRSTKLQAAHAAEDRKLSKFLENEYKRTRGITEREANMIKTSC